MQQGVILTGEEFSTINQKNTVNINIGVLGHVDSGKTSLTRVLSKITSTASLDKNPQSQERGITLDLGFSCFFTRIPGNKLEQFQTMNNEAKYFQFTLVDCPGHASLIRTIIGGAQIIDIMFLVIDINKGIQTQTAECLVIGEILMQKLIVVLNKIDMIAENEREIIVAKKVESLRKIFSKTKFGATLPIIPISACPGSTQENIDTKTGWKIDNLIEAIVDYVDPPQRLQNAKKGLLFMVDHCFALKGQGTVTTGTILQGSIKPNDELYFPQLNFSKKVKSMQMFKRPVEYAGPGDRVATLFSGLDPDQIERGIICQPGVVQLIDNLVVPINKVAYYKSSIKSNNKFHISSGHQTIMGQLKLFIRPKNIPFNSKQEEQKQNPNQKQDPVNKIFQDDPQGVDGEFYEEFEGYDEKPQIKEKFNIYGLLELEKPLLASENALIIASKLDSDLEANVCRIAFYGHIIATYQKDQLHQRLHIFRKKTRQGKVEKVLDQYTLLVKDLFKKETNINLFIGKTVILKITNNQGKIESAFGKSGKVKVHFSKGILHEPSKQQQEEQKDSDSKELEEKLVMSDVIMVFKKYLFQK